MKKILYLIFLMTLFIIKAKAEVYYSDYGDYEISNVPLISSDILDVNMVRYYMWYKLGKDVMDYELYRSDRTFLDDCYYTDYTDYSLEKPVEDESRFIEKQVSYVYTMPKKVRYIYLDDLQGSYGAFRITELMVKVDGVEINYDFTCKKCWGDFNEHIHNGIYDENFSYIDNGGSLTIDLKQEYDADKVQLIFYLFDMGTTTKTYYISLSQDGINKYVEQYFMWFFTLEHAKDSLIINHNVYNLNIPESIWTYKYETLEKLSSGYLYYDTITRYRYKELWCRRYNELITYSEVYSDEPIGDYTLKDENDFMDYYKFRKRDKIEIPEEIKIEEKNISLDDYIDSTSNYEIIGSIDYEINGNYKVTIKTPYISVDRIITINILENEINEKNKEIENLKEQIESIILKYETDINNLNIRITNLDKENSDYIEKNNNLLLEKERIIDEYNNNILNLNNELLILEENYENLRNQNNSLNINIENDLKEIYELKKENEQLADLNDAYYNKILEVDNVNKKTKENIQGAIENEEATKIYYESKISDLKNINDNLENKVNLLNNQINNSNEESIDLNTKINNYILKISFEKRKKTVILIAFTIIMIILILIKIQKKSSKK